MKMRYLIVFLAVFLVGCQSGRADTTRVNLLGWKVADLRALDPIDANGSTFDLMALYTRINQESFQMRLDFLDLERTKGQNIYILLDTNPGGENNVILAGGKALQADISWDYLLMIPDSGNVEVIDSHYLPVYGMNLLIVKDTIQDNITLSFCLDAVPIHRGTTTLQVITVNEDQSRLIDKINPAGIDAPSPEPAKVIFAFWNTFSARTPAETLRSWAGAHSGPMSTRHGLKYLLDAVAQTETNVALLDLMNPETLSALDYLGALTRMHKLINQDLLFIPGYVGGYDVMNKYKEKRRLFYLVENDYLYMFGGNDYAKFIINNDCLSIPKELNSTPKTSDLLIGCITGFLNQAILKSTTPLIIGGDFSDSLFGDPALCLSLLTYIHNHPWIQILTRNDLLAHPEYIPISLSSSPGDITTHYKTSVIYSTQNLPQPYSQIYKDLIQLPDNEISALGWEVFSSLYQAPDPRIAALSENYANQIGQIIAAAKWANQPYSYNRCDVDLDFDGKNECILSNNSLFMTIEPEGGYIPFAFSHDEHGSHQIIGPTWEFIVGISDPTEWDNTQGVYSDLGQILGALNDKTNYSEFLYFLNDEIVMYNSEMTMRKSYTISEDSIQINAIAPEAIPNDLYVPLSLDPWMRYSSHWADRFVYSAIPETINWGISSDILVNINSTATLSFYPFNSTHQLMPQPEDPNFDYPRGHYLPYPMALVELHPSGNYSIKITINP